MYFGFGNSQDDKCYNKQNKYYCLRKKGAKFQVPIEISDKNVQFVASNNSEWGLRRMFKYLKSTGD